MNAELTIYSSDTTLTATLADFLVEEFSDGIMLSADRFVYTIPNSEIKAIESQENGTRYFLNNGNKVVLTWLS